MPFAPPGDTRLRWAGLHCSGAEGWLALCGVSPWGECPQTSECRGSPSPHPWDRAQEAAGRGHLAVKPPEPGKPQDCLPGLLLPSTPDSCGGSQCETGWPSCQEGHEGTPYSLSHADLQRWNGVGVEQQHEAGQEGPQDEPLAHGPPVLPMVQHPGDLRPAERRGVSMGAGAGNSGHRQLRLRAVSWVWDTPGSTGSFGAGTARREVSQHPACPWQGTKSSGSVLPVHPLPASSKPKATPWAKARADGEAVAMETGEKGACHGAVQPQRGHPLPGNTSSSPALARHRHRHQGGGRDPFARGILRPGQGLCPPGTRWMLRHPCRQRRLQRGLTPPPAPGPSGGAGWESGGRRPAGTRVSGAGRHHLCTCVCATAHANTYVHAHVQARTARGQVHTRTRTGTQASPSPCTQRDVRTCMYMVPTPAASRVPTYVQGHRAARLHRLTCAHASTHMHRHAHACTCMYRYAQAAPCPPPQCRPPCPAAPSPRAQPLARCSAQGAPAAPLHCSRAVLCGGTRGHAARHPHRLRAEPDAREHPPSGRMKPRAAPPASQPRLAAAAAASPPARSGRCSGSWHPWAALPLNNLPQQPPRAPAEPCCSGR